MVGGLHCLGSHGYAVLGGWIDNEHLERSILLPVATAAEPSYKEPQFAFEVRCHCSRRQSSVQRRMRCPDRRNGLVQRKEWRILGDISMPSLELLSLCLDAKNAANTDSKVNLAMLSSSLNEYA